MYYYPSSALFLTTSSIHLKIFCEKGFFSAGINNKEIYFSFSPLQQPVPKAEIWGNLKWNVPLQISFFPLFKSPNRASLFMKDEAK